MSIEVSRVGALQGLPEASEAQPRPRLELGSGQAVRPHAVAGVIDDTLPQRPPSQVLEEMRAAEERYDELRAQQRELHFEHDEQANRVVVEVRDLEGNVLRTIPPSKALAIIFGEPVNY